MLLRHPIFSLTPGRFIAGAFVAGVLFVSSVASASAQQVMAGGGASGDLTVRAVLKEVGSWASNPLMIISGARSLWGSTTSPELILKSSTPLSEMSLNARVDEGVFNQSVFNSTDAHGTADLSTRNERWLVGVQGRVDYDTTRTSELTNFNFSPVVARHTGLSVAPRISFNPTPANTFSLSGSVDTSRYNKDIFSNYENFSATSSYSHQFDPLYAGVLSVQAQRYQTTRNNAVRVDNWGPSIGLQALFSSRFSANASVGAQTSRQYNFGVAIDDWRWEYTFAGGLSFKGQQDTLNLSATRAQAPYGNGTSALNTSFSLTESHNLNPSFTLNLGAKYLTSEYQTTTTGNLESLADGHLGIAYHLTDDFDLTADYRYRYETLTNLTKTVHDNSVMIGLVFHPKGWDL